MKAVCLASFSILTAVSLGMGPQSNSFSNYQAVTKDITEMDLIVLARAEGAQFGPDDIETRPELKEVQAMTPLTACRRLSNKFSKSIDLLKKANELPVSPLNMTDEESVQFAVKLSQYLKIQARIGHLQMAEGSPVAAMNSWISVLQATQRVGSAGNHVVALVMGKNISYTFAILEQHIGRIPLDSCQSLILYINNYLSSDSHLTTLLTKLIDSKSKHLTAVFSDPSQKSEGEEDDPALKELATSLGHEARMRLLTEVTTHLSGISKQARDLTSKPESEWFVQNQITIESGNPNVNSVLQRLNLNDNILGTLSFMAKARTQFRLARLHSEIQIYRFQNEKLPDALTELYNAYVDDPLAKGFFILERRATGYRLFSKGNGTLGEIELRYRTTHPEGARSIDP